MIDRLESVESISKEDIKIPLVNWCPYRHGVQSGLIVTIIVMRVHVLYP